MLQALITHVRVILFPAYTFDELELSQAVASHSFDSDIVAEQYATLTRVSIHRRMFRCKRRLLVSHRVAAAT